MYATSGCISQYLGWQNTNDRIFAIIITADDLEICLHYNPLLLIYKPNSIIAACFCGLGAWQSNLSATCQCSVFFVRHFLAPVRRLTWLTPVFLSDLV